jgi:hypothetical protein
MPQSRSDDLVKFIHTVFCECHLNQRSLSPFFFFDRKLTQLLLRLHILHVVQFFFEKAPKSMLRNYK